MLDIELSIEKLIEIWNKVASSTRITFIHDYNMVGIISYNFSRKIFTIEVTSIYYSEDNCSYQNCTKSNQL